MEQLFRLTELEVRVPLNLNVIDPLGVPRVMNLKEALQAFLDHRREVLQRRSRHRLAAVARRMEVLRGFVIVYLNLDEVIRIIREVGRPESRDDRALGPDRGAGRGDPQHAAARVAPARRNRDQEGAGGARPPKSSELEALLASDKRQWRALAKEVAATQAEFGGDTPLGRRRTLIGAAPEPVEIPVAALVEREPVTVLLSQKGWIRAVKGHGDQSGRAEIQGRRRAALRGAGGNHRPAARVRQQRPVLYARAPTVCRAAAARASRCG